MLVPPRAEALESRFARPGLLADFRVRLYDFVVEHVSFAVNSLGQRFRCALF
jgi:hypothetical protein